MLQIYWILADTKADQLIDLYNYQWNKYGTRLTEPKLIPYIPRIPNTFLGHLDNVERFISQPPHHPRRVT